MQSFENLLLQNYSTKFLDITYKYVIVMQTFENLILQNCLTEFYDIAHNSMILHTNNPWVCLIKVCSNGGATYIIGKIIAKSLK